jgi:hypothetical protein
MHTETITHAVEELRGVYGDSVQESREGGRTLIKIAGVELPPGCRPEKSDVLVVLDPAAARPVVYVRPGVLLPNGASPRSTSPTAVGGESWLGFSFAFPWTEAESIITFLAVARQRFARHD